MMQSTQVTKTGMMKEHAIVVDMPTESPKTHDARDTPLQQQCTWYPHCCGRPVFRGNREALGWCMDVIGRTLSILSIGAFLMPALLTLAKEAASCPDEGECTNRVYGIRPSSLLTLEHTIVSVAAAPLMPLLGATVDHTQHRRLLGRWISVGFLMLLFPQIFVSSQTWFAIVILQLFLFFVFLFQMVMAYSYLPELTTDEDTLNAFTRNFTVAAFGVVVAYITIIVAVTGALHIANDSVLVAHIAIAASFTIALITFCRWLGAGCLTNDHPCTSYLLINPYGRLDSISSITRPSQSTITTTP